MYRGRLCDTISSGGIWSVSGGCSGSRRHGPGESGQAPACAGGPQEKCRRHAGDWTGPSSRRSLAGERTGLGPRRSLAGERTGPGSGSRRHGPGESGQAPTCAGGPQEKSAEDMQETGQAPARAGDPQEPCRRPAVQPQHISAKGSGETIFNGREYL